MSAYTLPARLTLWQRILFAVPLLGRIFKEVAYGPEENIGYALATFVSLWGCSVLLFGIPGLYIPALCMVPVMFLVLLSITRG
ncbi:hypothetical protein [Leisingera sp. ANG-S5]|uniref:hypothetical protein n=1 Tax=Leisingera sp. ANG-S5 TaxID=1577901 RepID=UPI00057F9DE5|nr:hypothetical protein [Leisingera sp. ANG-S5]KIC30821.1 hypothetical protein RA25_18030 [Leisingera sp. ANG-S5]